MTFVQAGTTPERLVLAAAATADANGLIAFRLGPAPLGFVWQGSVTVTNAPSGALFNSSVGSTPWGQHAGATNFGPVQLWGNETLTVAGVGLQRNTQYTLTFFGVSLPEAQADPLPPVAPTSVVNVETATVLRTFTGSAANGTFSIRPPSLTRRLTLVFTAPGGGVTLPSNILLTGDQTGAVYGNFTNLSGSPQPFFFAVEPSIDSTYTFTFSGGANNCTCTIIATATNPLTYVQTFRDTPLEVAGPADANLAPNPVRVAGSPVGPFNSYLSPTLGVGNNQVLIAAPGAGRSLYLQTLYIGNRTLAAGAAALAIFHDSAGNIISKPQITGGSESFCSLTFPGGLELVANQGLQVDVIGNGLDMSFSWAVGPTL